VNHRILFIIEDLFELGPAHQLLGLASELATRGAKIQIGVLGQREIEPVKWESAGVKVTFLNGDDQTPLHTIRDGFQVCKELRALIQSFQPSIVHSWCGISELFMLLATKDWPLVKPHSSFRLISTELYRQPEKRFLRQTIEKQLARKVERMLVPHASVKTHLVENGYRDYRIDVVPNAVFETGVPANREPAKLRLRERLGLAESAYVAGTVAPLHARSRLKDLIWATDLLTCIRDDFHLAIVGKGSQLRRLKRFAALTESKSHIHFLEHPESPNEVVSGLDFYWHSHLDDPLSSNLLSAMAKGIPAISVFGEGTEEIVRPQETGFGVNFGARDEFARWTKYLIEQIEPGKQLARQGREFVCQNFDKQRMIEGYLGIYDLTS
jgi:glycosyltransferase involved in cell wall biosynthesis